MSRNRCVWLSIRPGSNVASPRSTVLVPGGALICEALPTCLILSPSISTAAGEITLPVRGSSSRPAFTRVIGVPDCCCAEPVQRDNSITASNRNNLCIPCIFIFPASGTKARIDDHESHEAVALIVQSTPANSGLPKRNHRVKSGCALCRDVAGQERDNEQRRRHTDKDRRIMWAHSVHD